MSHLAQSLLRGVESRAEYASRLLEDAADGGHEAMIGHAYAEVLLLRGELAAIRQLMDLEETLATDKPRVSPPLRIVR